MLPSKDSRSVSHRHLSPTHHAGNSDFLTLANVFASWRRASDNHNYVRTFCKKNYLSHQNLQQIEELRQQLLSYLIDSSIVDITHQQQQEKCVNVLGDADTSGFALPAASELASSQCPPRTTPMPTTQTSSAQPLPLAYTPNCSILMSMACRPSAISSQSQW